MNNEAEIQNKPVEDGAIVIDPNDFVEVEKDDEAVEDTTEPTETEVNTPDETKTEDVDYTPFLTKISETAKYNKEPVKLEKFDDVIDNIEKGLNYDNLKSKYEALENSEEMTYIKEQAKLAGMSTTDYIKALKAYEVQQQEAQDKEQYEELIGNGISEATAKDIMETRQIAREWKQDKVRRDEEAKIREEQSKKDAENKLFLETFPDVDVNTIPAEVFQKGEKIGLIAAYALYKSEQQSKQIDVIKKQEENETKAPVKGTTEHGGVVEDKDDFLKGFNLR